MYKIEVLSIAKKDIDETIYYISHNLKNVSAAKKLRDLFIKSFDNIIEFPYIGTIYQPVDTLKYKYRSYKIKNFIMFYIVDEKQKIIIIARVLYQKMDINNILE